MTVFVVGALHLDVVVHASHLPGLDETVVGRSVEYIFGGKGGNQAVAAARTGATVHFGGRAGSDWFGDVLRAKLKSAGVDTSQLQVDPGPSGMSTAIVNEDGDYGAVIVSAANQNIDCTRLSLPAQTSIVLLQNEVPEMVNVSIATQAKEAGASVWLNAAPARALSRDLDDLIDLLIINKVEHAFYDALQSSSSRLVTQGAEGVEFEGHRWPAFDVNVVSTHGAGDMFIGALAAAVSSGSSLAKALPFAQAAAAWHVSTNVSERETTPPDVLAAALQDQLIR